MGKYLTMHVQDGMNFIEESRQRVENGGKVGLERKKKLVESAAICGWQERQVVVFSSRGVLGIRVFK